MPIGALRHRVVLQSPSAPPMAAAARPDLETVAELWAASGLSPAMSACADALSGRVTHEVWVRHRAGVPAMRFLSAAASSTSSRSSTPGRVAADASNACAGSEIYDDSPHDAISSRDLDD